MDLATRKYNFIQELINNVNTEHVLEALEKMLEQKKKKIKNFLMKSNINWITDYQIITTIPKTCLIGTKSSYCL